MEREYSQKYLQINKGKSIVFDAKDLSFFYVAPNLSDLGESLPVARELVDEYSALNFRKACLIDGAILIQDLVPFSSSAVNRELTILTKELNQISNITLQIVDGNTLTQDLIQLFEALKIDNPLFIFPGEGARIVNDYLSRISIDFNSQTKIFLPTRRIKIGSGKFNLQVDYSPLPQSIDTQTLVIVDDVIATGQTAETIALALKKKYGNIRVVMASWIYLKPPLKKQSTSGINNIDQTLTSLALKGNYLARPPINSLSCFIREGEKYDQVKNNFLQKYITDQESFERILREMRGTT